MSTGRPQSIEDAIACACEAREQKKWLWPQYISAYLEDRRQGSTLDFTILIYELIAQRKNNAAFSNFLSLTVDLNRASPLTPQKRMKLLSKEIWYSEEDNTPSRKGLTRVLDAMQLLGERSYNKYFVEVSRALKMAIEDEDFGVELDEVKMILHNFRP